MNTSVQTIVRTVGMIVCVPSVKGGGQENFVTHLVTSNIVRSVISMEHAVFVFRDDMVMIVSLSVQIVKLAFQIVQKRMVTVACHVKKENTCMSYWAYAYPVRVIVSHVCQERTVHPVKMDFMVVNVVKNVRKIVSVVYQRQNVLRVIPVGLVKNVNAI